jgi:RNA polymerase sigma factor (TIGR02999 family)
VQETDIGPVNSWLRAWSAGNREALEAVLPLVFDKLHRIAEREMARERAGHTLEATALLHEVYLRLRRVEGLHWQDHNRFFAFVTHLMRRTLIDHARRRARLRNGGAWRKVALAETREIGLATPPELLALDEALEVLGQLDPRKAAVVELRFFGGFSVEEIGRELAVSVETVGREWRKARAWLFHFLRPSAEGPHAAGSGAAVGKSVPAES